MASHPSGHDPAGRPAAPPSTSALAALDELTEEQVFGSKKRRYHHAQDPIESSLNASQLLLSQSLSQPLPPPPPRPLSASIAASAVSISATTSADAAMSSSVSAAMDGPTAMGGEGGTTTVSGAALGRSTSTAPMTARIPVRAKGAAKKSRLDFHPQPLPTASSTADRPIGSSGDDDAQVVDDQLTDIGSGGAVKRPRHEGVGSHARAASADAVDARGGLEDEVRGEREKRKKVLSRAPKRNLLQFLPPPPPPVARPAYALAAPPAAAHPAAHPTERSIDTTMPLQISDTPMIRRNQAMRSQAALGVSSSSSSGPSSGKGGGGRKSSFGKRGNRASASFGEGRLSAPHGSIPTAEFHRHVDRALPEAVRMRHLLVFLGKRLLDPLAPGAESAGAGGAKGKGKAVEGHSVESTRERIVRETQEEVLRAILGAKVDTNPCGGHRGTNLLEKPTRPHPGNVENRKVSDQAEAFIKRGKAEESLWSQAVKAANALQTSTCEQLAAKKAAAEASADPLDDLALVGGDSEARDAAVADLLRSVLGSQAADAVDIDELEFHIDTIHQVTQTAVQLSAESTTLLDSLFHTLTTALRTRATAAHGPHAAAAGGAAAAAALAHTPGALLVPIAERQSRRRGVTVGGGEARRVLRRLAEQEGAKPTLSVRAAHAELVALGPPTLIFGTSSGPQPQQAGRASTPPPAAAALGASVSSKAKTGLPPVTPRKGAATPRKGTGTTPFRSRTPAAPQAE